MGRAIVIGAGIGGLTAALALTARGWDVEVHERAPALGAVGSCLALGPNAMRALDSIPGGLADELRAFSLPPQFGGIRSRRGAVLIEQDLRMLQTRFGDTLLPIERPALIDLLAAHLPAGALRVGAEVHHVEPDSGTVTMVSSEVLRADLVVAADGMRSPTRRTLFPGRPGPRFLGRTAWLLVAPAEGLDLVVGEVWGDGLMVGTIPMVDGRVYAFAESLSSAPYRPRTPAEEKAELVRLVAGFPAPIPELIERTDPATIVRADIHSQQRPLPAYHRGRVALLGDAAHTMTPNLGQGACIAMEDAVVLARFADDLAAYSAARRRRTRQVVRTAAMVARMSTSRGIASSLRDRALPAIARLAPKMPERQADALFAWTPPADVPALQG